LHLPLLAALVLAIPATTSAQRLERGARIRVRPPCEQREACYPIIGEFRSISGDTLTMRRADGGVESLHLGPDMRLDLSHGYRRRWPEGLAAGFVAGVVVGYLAKTSCESPVGDDSICGLYYLVTVPPGILLGGIIGAHHTVEWWLPAQRVAVGFVPLRRGVGMGLRLGF
jgi:hypothetical protein